MLSVSDKLVPGLYEVIQKTVEDADTAVHYGSGVLEELIATPVYVDLLIKAAVEVADKNLPEGFITVGKSMEFTHDAPTGLGVAVSVKATLVKVDGNQLSFDIVAYDEIGEIGRGKHERVIVNRQQMLKKARERMSLINKRYIK